MFRKKPTIYNQVMLELSKAIFYKTAFLETLL